MQACVTEYHVILYRATWWQLGLNSKEDFVFHCANCWFERWRGRSLSDCQHSHTATSSSCGNKCAHWRRSIADQREVQQGTVAQVTQGQHSGCIFPLKGNIYRSCQWLLESLDLGSLCWLIFGGKSTECGKFKAG